MVQKLNPRQLVLRRDTATGLTLVGWETELPVGRFEHLELVYESPYVRQQENDSAFLEAYQSALRLARRTNRRMLEQQVRLNLARGWYKVPFGLALQQQTMRADSVGNYAPAAMQLHYDLTRNIKQAWVIIRQDKVEHVRARYPRKMLDELTYQVWYHKQKYELQAMGGTLLEGDLIVYESGLWFKTAD